MRPTSFSSPPQKLIIVGISDCAVSGDGASSLITYALGSCIGVCAYDPVARVGGMLHIILPESSLNPAKAGQNPFMFADTGLPRMFEQIAARGGDRKRVIVALAGGAQLMDGDGIFNIGKRNYIAVKKLLWKAGVLVAGEAVGGNVSRTVRLDLASGGLFVREGGREEREISLKGRQI